MPAARGVKRTASKAAAASTASSASSVSKNKKKRGVQLEIPNAPKKRGRVLTCGQGDVGQLGLGEDVIETTKFKNVTALGNKIVDACAGGMHTIALDNDGKVWTFGCNDEGALGRATSGETDEGTPKKVALPHPAVAVTAGDSHSSALLNNGDVYAWGAFRDSHGSMGLVVRGREGKPCREPVQIEIGEPAAAIASGGDHLVVLSTSGSVYTMGCGEQGQLGRLSQRSASRDARQGFTALLIPSKVTLKGGASRIWAGYHATFALDSNDKMFAWGLNNYGQLGITGEKRKVALYAPIECDAFGSCHAEWRTVSCGQHHSLALDTTGQVYAIGRCEYGRLGLGDRAGDAEILEPVPKLQNKKCVSIAAGTSNSFAVTDTGEIFAWGMGSEGQLGTGSSSDASEPTPAVIGDGEGLLPVHVSAGGQHTVVFVEDKSAQKEKTPVPEPEPEEEKVEDATEEEDEEKEEEEEKPRAKRAKKKDQEEEISSTSNAQVEQVEEKSKPKKLNGDKKKDTPMEVDETDNPVDKKQTTDTETKPEDKEIKKPSDEPSKATMDLPSEDTKEQPKEESLPEQKTDDVNVQKHTEENSEKVELNSEKVELNTEKVEEPMEESQPETESSQDTIETEKKSVTEMTETVVNDVEMVEKPEINGTEETQIVETKSVDVTPTPTAITTTA